MKKILLIISGFSGVGKGTVVDLLITRNPAINLIHSCTTRPKRNDSDVYEFLSKEEFIARNNENYFFETAMYSGSENFYGTPKKPIYKSWENNQIPLVEINTAGFVQLKEHPELSDCIIKSIFIAAEPATLLDRLKNRQTESVPSIIKRLETAREESFDIPKYDCVIFNNSVINTVKKMEQYVFHNTQVTENLDTVLFTDQLARIIYRLKNTV